MASRADLSTTDPGDIRRRFKVPTARQVELAIRALALLCAALGTPLLAVAAAATGRPLLVLGSVAASGPLAVARMIAPPGDPLPPTADH
jgi:hypothetical protein